MYCTNEHKSKQSMSNTANILYLAQYKMNPFTIINSQANDYTDCA